MCWFEHAYFTMLSLSLLVLSNPQVGINQPQTYTKHAFTIKLFNFSEIGGTHCEETKHVVPQNKEVVLFELKLEQAMELPSQDFHFSRTSKSNIPLVKVSYTTFKEYYASRMHVTLL